MALPATASLPQNGSIVARWNLNESSGNRSDSVGSNTLTDTNTVGSASGQFGENAADFETSNTEYLTIADNAALSITGDMIFGAWVQIESLPGSGLFRGIMSKYQASGNNRDYYFAYQNNGGTPRLVFTASSDGISPVVTSVNYTLTLATWFHVAIRYDASAGGVDFFVNGVQTGTQQTGLPTSIHNGSSNFDLGSTNHTDGDYDGLMQDAIMYSGVYMNDTEMQDWYDAYSESPFIPKVIIT